MNSKRKFRRNAPCPCGSGKKYKKCHGTSRPQKTHPPNPFDMGDIKQKLEQMKASEIQRTKQQGEGRPIISAVFKGYRFVAVANRFYYSKNWKTFPDFLCHYIKSIFGSDWGNAELKKDFNDRHPIIQWYDYVCKEQRKSIKEKGKPATVIMTGAVFGYLTLSYNLYLLAHNTELHSRLINRLKNRQLFYPAFYETMVAASFIKAGFTIEIEDEDDPTSDHAEFVAISQKTSKKYSVEAKHRMAGKQHFDVTTQLFKALKKDLPYERVVFIDLNVPQNIDEAGRLKWLDEVISRIRKHENALINDQPAPPAYVFITNHPFLYNLDSFRFSPAAVAEGFKIPDFKVDSAFSSLRDALKSREKHIDVLDLMKAMKEYDPIPCTFDGEIPEYAFGEIEEARLKIGNKYLVPDDSGKEVVGVLKDAIVCGEKVTGIYETENGQQIIVGCPMTEQERKVYQQYPDTFFGVHKETSKKIKDPLDLYDFFYDTYRNSTKEKLLEFLKGSPDFDLLKNETQQELAIIFCERSVYSIMREDLKKRTTNGKV